MPRVTVPTDKAGRRTGKGVHAEENDPLMDYLSGCAVKSCMSVTDRGFQISRNQVECYGKKKEYASLALLAERLFTL